MKTEDQKYRITGKNANAYRWQYEGDVLLSFRQAVSHAAKANRVHAKKAATGRRHVFAVIDESGRVVWGANNG